MNISNALLWIARHRVELAVTLAMLLVYQLGSRLPFPGLPEAFLQNRDGPVFSLSGGGIFAWMMALAVLELVSLGYQRLRNGSWIEAGHANPFSKPVVFLSLTFAVFQAYSGIVGMWMYLLPGSAPGWLDLATIATTAAAALAATILVASVIDRFGLGRGFWTLILWVTAQSLAPDLIDLLLRLRLRLNAEELIFQQWEIWTQLVLLVAVTCLAVAFVRLATDDGEKAPLNAIWPFFMAALLSSWLFQLLFAVLSAALGPAGVQVFLGVHYFWLWAAIEAVLTFNFIWIYFRSSVRAPVFLVCVVIAGTTVALSKMNYAVFERTVVNIEPLKFVLAAAFLLSMRDMGRAGKVGTHP